MKYLIAGNWKMNGSAAFSQSLCADIIKTLHQDTTLIERCDFAVAPASPYLSLVKNALDGQAVFVAAQDVSAQDTGAYTGDISVDMLADLGVSHVILGHSERRQYHHETDQSIAQKAIKAWSKNIVTIICVGETEQQREQNIQEKIVKDQLDVAIPNAASAENTVIAYEPVWAIGTGKTATAEDVRAMHAFIRAELKARFGEAGNAIRILYGGSVKPSNAAELMQTANVNGALIGGASLKADDFMAIAAATPL
jgi:triosephosphate isomerase